MGLRAMVLAAGAVAALLSGRAEAQGVDTPGGIERLRRACEGSMARVTTTAGEEVRGRCGPVEDTRLVVLSEGDGVREIPLRTVEGIWVRRSGVRQGAGTGALIGGVGGAAWALLAVTTLCGGGGSGCQDDMLIGAIAGGALGSLTGVVVGGAIGSTTRVWVRLHP